MFNTDPHFDLVNSNPISSFDHSVLADAKSEYFGDLATYKVLSDRRKRANEAFMTADSDRAVRMMHIAYVCAVGSIRTDTGHWEDMVGRYLRADLEPADMVGQTTDGRVKAEKVTHVLEDTTIVRKATNLAKAGDTEGAMLALTGRLTDDTDDTYVRTTKASFILWLLGFDVWCIDHRIHGQITRDGFLLKVLEPVPTRRPPTKRSRVTAEKKTPMDVEWWHDTLKWNPVEYHHHADAVMQRIADETDIPKDRVSQVLFNMAGDERRIHDTLTGLLGA